MLANHDKIDSQQRNMIEHTPPLEHGEKTRYTTNIKTSIKKLPIHMPAIEGSTFEKQNSNQNRFFTLHEIADGWAILSSSQVIPVFDLPNIDSVEENGRLNFLSLRLGDQIHAIRTLYLSVAKQCPKKFEPDTTVKCRHLLDFRSQGSPTEPFDGALAPRIPALLFLLPRILAAAVTNKST